LPLSTVELYTRNRRIFKRKRYLLRTGDSASLKVCTISDAEFTVTCDMAMLRKLGV